MDATTEAERIVISLPIGKEAVICENSNLLSRLECRIYSMIVFNTWGVAVDVCCLYHESFVFTDVPLELLKDKLIAPGISIGLGSGDQEIRIEYPSLYTIELRNIIKI